ncbi:hypothetical protein FRC02_006412 [Tulasnella sp. 418]|nr:hypothetical protein FRC02_006412 [Tulasnella sp. 418]
MKTNAPLDNSEITPNAAPVSNIDKIIQSSIKATGPITVARYIQYCLWHPKEGYYMKNDVFGSRGDFITSPEISQVFGELLALWALSHWMASGKPSATRMVELGPGRGTLMDDMLRTLSRFPDFWKTMKDIHLVETSEFLRSSQKQRLSGYSVPLKWYDRIDDIAKDESHTMVFAHEFFDALPIHILQNTEQGYKEVHVDLASNNQSENQISTDSDKPHLFKFALAPELSASSALLANSSPRFLSKPVGSRVEISPLSWKIAKSVGELITGPLGGSALIVDYGDDHAFGDSFRAFRKHELVDVFHDPGNSDLTANVDFAYLREAVSGIASCHGPMTQRDFLGRMGIQPRMQALMAKADPDRQREIGSSIMRLVDPIGMGTQYKVMAMTPSTDAEVYPFLQYQ